MEEKNGFMKNFNILKTFQSAQKDMESYFQNNNSEYSKTSKKELKEFIKIMKDNGCFSEKSTDNKKDGFLFRIQSDIREVKNKEEFDALFNKIKKSLDFEMKGGKKNKQITNYLRGSLNSAMKSIINIQYEKRYFKNILKIF